MKAKRLNFQQVLKLTQNYMHRRRQALLKYLYPFRTKRGRPKKYPDEIILVLLFLQVAWRLSFRDLEYLAVQMFGSLLLPPKTASPGSPYKLPQFNLQRTLEEIKITFHHLICFVNILEN